MLVDGIVENTLLKIHENTAQILVKSMVSNVKQLVPPEVCSSMLAVPTSKMPPSSLPLGTRCSVVVRKVFHDWQVVC